ncbi:hypothetical protein [Anthocerotibacter panamensis]|uniref:hypothetical protein n=1 Tax=Anthocerotibacter panamensis TaxID=2857077 RepID=UPI001C402797|nr:hypothetical protein [Anthocerotibacter panamensis]
MALADQWLQGKQERWQQCQQRTSEVQTNLAQYRKQRQQLADQFQQEALQLRSSLRTHRLALAQEVEAHLQNLQQKRALATQALRTDLSQFRATLAQQNQTQQQERTLTRIALAQQLYSTLDAERSRRQTAVWGASVPAPAAVDHLQDFQPPTMEASQNQKRPGEGQRRRPRDLRPNFLDNIQEQLAVAKAEQTLEPFGA